MSHLSLQGKTLVIIGGTSGIGFSAARAFIAAGANVVIVGLDETKVDAAKKKLRRSARAIQGDARQPQTAERAVQEAISAFHGFDGLYHVAGGSGRGWGDGPLHEITDSGWDETIKLNITSLMYSNRAAVRQFQEQQSGGSILNISSVLGFSPSTHYFATHAYAAAKAAVVGFTKALAAYYAPLNIRFNVLAPALIETPMSQRAVASQEIMDFMKTKQPLDGGRVGQPSDLDAAAVYFMSDDSKFTTGQVMAIDGGWCVSEGQYGP
jgi:NAD(P)-dependent dehydrogenase (short-subunit alcohol dehydrogenase family)